MKNTVKKILALVFVVAMVCSLAVPAFAEDEKVRAEVKVVLPSGELVSTTVTIEAKKATVENVLEKETAIDNVLDINGSTGKVSAIKVNKGDASTTKVTNAAITGEFGTGSVIVAVNGKAVSEDLDTVTVEDGDHITVYWADSKLGTKLAMVDDSNIAAGIISLYYFDAEGNRQPLKGAKISVKTAKGSDAYKTFGAYLKDLTNVLYAEEDVVYAKHTDCEYYFTTDEKGQIWLAPEYLAVEKDAVYTISLPMVNPGADDEFKGVADADVVFYGALKGIKTDDGYTKKEVEYYNDRLNRNIVDVEVIGYNVEVEADLYNVAGATGDMTVVYALVAFAAVATLAAVVVMKKKSVKAN